MQAWVEARLDGGGRVQLSGDSDSALTRGLVAVLLHSLCGLTPEEVLAVEPASLAGLVSIGPSCCCCRRSVAVSILLSICFQPDLARSSGAVEQQWYMCASWCRGWVPPS